LGSCKIEDAQAIREGKKKEQICLKQKGLLFRRRRYPALVIWFLEIASRAAKERCDAGFGLTKQAKRFI
jgi:succinate dehydrogenase / fumarate reductase flavoprotein subunit